MSHHNCHKSRCKRKSRKECLEVGTLKAYKVKTCKLTSKKETTLCGNTTVKGILDLSKAKVIPNDNPILGWWIQVSQGLIAQQSTLINFTCEAGSDEVVGKFYSGGIGNSDQPGLGRIREMTNWELDGFFLGWWDLDSDTYVMNKISDTEYTFAETFIPGVPYGFTIQDDENVAVLAGAQNGFNEHILSKIYYKIDESLLPPITTSATPSDNLLEFPVRGSGGTVYNVNSPVNAFKEATDYTLFQYNTSFAKDLDTTSLSYSGLYNFEENVEKALTTGYGSTLSTLSNVWPGDYTTIFTEDFHNAALGVKVTISGFGTGSDSDTPFKVLNAMTRPVVGSGREQSYYDFKKYWESTHVDTDDLKYYFNIPIDTSSIRALNRDYNPEVDGEATVLVEYEPITENVSPADFYANMQRFICDNHVGTHTFSTAWRNPDGTFFDGSWGDFADQVNAGDWGIDILRTRTINMVSGIGYGVAQRGGVLRNDIYRTPQNNGDFNIPVENYLEEKFEMYWAIDQNTPEDPQGLSQDFYGVSGSRFMFTYAPVGSLPTFPYPGAPQAPNGTVWELVVVSPTFGTVIDGESIYIHMRSMIQGDGNNLYLNPDFQPNGTLPGYPDLFSVSGCQAVSIQMYAVLMEKLTSYNRNKLIVDIRSNFGGEDTVAYGLSTFLGDDRTTNSYNSIERFVDAGGRPSFTVRDLVDDGIKLTGIDPAFTVSVVGTTPNAAVSGIYPDSMFQGEGKTVVLLTSTNALSTGDDVPFFFLGNDPNNSRDMGEGVTLKIAGEVDGRCLCFNGIHYLTSTEDSILKLFGVPAPLIPVINNEYSHLSQKKDYEPSNNQLVQTIPDLLMKPWYENNAWPDAGSVTPHPNVGSVIPGWSAPLGSTKQEITIQTTADVANSLQSKYWTISTVSSDYYVWYDVSGGGVDPSPGGIGVKVDINTNDSADAVAIATVNALGLQVNVAISDEFKLGFDTTSKIRITNNVPGVVTPAADFNTGFTIIVVKSGLENLVGQPVTSDRSTWRDTPLETALDC